MREEIQPSLKTGHFHIAKIQSVDEDLKFLEIKQVLDVVTSSIKEGIKGIKP